MPPFVHTREFPASVEAVFAAFSSSERLARWWGPAGFSNTFKVCELQSGGRWSFTMHGPDGKDYQNDSVFELVEAPTKVVIAHASLPKYRLTITLAPSAQGTLVTWSQDFEDPKVAEAIAHIVKPANEQNLDRWSAEVQGNS